MTVTCLQGTSFIKHLTIFSVNRQA